MLEDFDNRHTGNIDCPVCGKHLQVTEWTTFVQCSCGHFMDSWDLLFESFIQTQTLKIPRHPVVVRSYR